MNYCNTNTKTRKALKKCFSVVLGIYFFAFSMMPQNAMALTGGPSQPEVQSFEPIGTSDMVDLFSGDFVYNIPLLDVGGYPINLSYHSGITMDQEASWVGLGWNINPGVINRAMRGIPDDFKGEEITQELNLKPNRTYGGGVAFDWELFGLGKSESSTLSISANLGVSYNNYTGVGAEIGVNSALSITGKNGYKGTYGLGLSSSSSGGLDITPSVSLATKYDRVNNLFPIGGTFNTREGLKNLTIAPQSKKINKKSGVSIGFSGKFDLMQPTYTPQVERNMRTLSFSGKFKVAGELLGINPGVAINGYYNEQRLAESSISHPAYGYFHSDLGQTKDNAMMDFNREKDGSFTKNTPALPLTNFTYDLFSVAGQGVGGSYRGFRGDIGYVSDPAAKSTSGSGSLGIELGAGNLTHVGADVSVVIATSKSGKWKRLNQAKDKLKYRSNKPYPLYEKYYLKEANEKSVSSDEDFIKRMGGAEPSRFGLKEILPFTTRLTDELEGPGSDNNKVVGSNVRSKREKRSQVINMLTRAELTAGYGFAPPHPDSHAGEDHHIAEITSLGTDGSRYVYGLAAYNTEQQDVTFAVGAGKYESSLPHTPDHGEGLVAYNAVADGTSNSHGIDNYYSNTTTPAYAHSYLLTAVVSPDYADLTFDGPTADDLGSYTLFHYDKANDYNWRVPVTPAGMVRAASYNPGLNSNKEDDRASYVYGEKELWYLDKIETKNYVAIFHKSNREDGCGVVNEDGKIDDNNNMQRLDKISLYTQPEYQAHSGNLANATPIKEVHFEYDYSLCPGITNSNTGSGKLTLTKVWFTYRHSERGKLSPYAFNYDMSNNPGYNLKGYDRWGNYKENLGGGVSASSPLSTSDFPYVDQLNPAQQDLNASAWNLSSIDLPSGGTIEVDYESDDYAFVQSRKAMQMLKITGVVSPPSTASVVNISNNAQRNKKLQFELLPGYNTPADIPKYFEGIKDLYFRALMKFGDDPDDLDYVSGYCQVKDYGLVNSTTGWVELEPVKLKNLGGSDYNPIVLAAIQFGRMSMPQMIFDNQPNIDENASFGADLINALLQSTTGFISGFKNANKSIYDKDIGVDLVTGKSWLRLNNVNGFKKGGGVRVKRLAMSDSWGLMASNGSSFSYGQEYSYETELPDGSIISSGVAAYEPQLGGDENPWRQPNYFDKKMLLVPDYKFFQEEPYGESFFPSASVGYSRVEVRNLARPNVTRHATGHTVHEFYTAREFPTITKRTTVEHDRDRIPVFSINNILSNTLGLGVSATADFMTASQGFSVELNDMHGKPKGQHVYPEGKEEPISSVEYHYKMKTHTLPPFLGSLGNVQVKKLDNTVTVIEPNGTQRDAEVGVFFDMVADFRESKNNTVAPNLKFNFDLFVFPPFVFVPTFTVYPHLTLDKTQFRSSSTTKVIQRFGILEKTVATDLGSTVTTANLAYDAETGAVLVTRQNNSFGDDIYSLNYPAYWHYQSMGPAFRNIGFNTNLTFSASGVASTPYAAYFNEGDELILYGSAIKKGWVTDVGTGNITVVAWDGTPVTGTIPVKVVRSGKRNLQSQSMASVTTLANPLNTFGSNVFENVIQASAIEYTDEWRTYCECFEDGQGSMTTTNPYVLGTRGNFRPKISYSHLAPRLQTDENENTNIREDGMLTSYTPFYQLNNAAKWVIDRENWTYTAEATEFNQRGMELESKDALGRYSAATYSFNQTVETAVAANSRLRELGYDGFEDRDFDPCGDKHFRFDGTLDKSNAHTGYASIRVASNAQPVTLLKDLEWCDPPGCNVTAGLAVSGAGGSSITVAPAGGVLPYLIDYIVISGSPNVSLDPQTGSLTLIQNGSFDVKVTFVDAEGCTVTKFVGVANNQPYIN